MTYQAQKDLEIAFFEQEPSLTGLESRAVGNGDTVTFSASIVAKKVHIIYNESDADPVFYTLNGQDPVITEGSGSNIGRPLAPEREHRIYFPSGSYTLKITDRATGGGSTVHLYDLVSIHKAYY